MFMSENVLTFLAWKMIITIIITIITASFCPHRLILSALLNTSWFLWIRLSQRLLLHTFESLQVVLCWAFEYCQLNEIHKNLNLFRNMSSVSDGRGKALTAAWLTLSLPRLLSSLSITSFLPENSLLLFYLFSVQIGAGRLLLLLCFQTGQHKSSRHIQPFPQCVWRVQSVHFMSSCIDPTIIPIWFWWFPK